MNSLVMDAIVNRTKVELSSIESSGKAFNYYQQKICSIVVNHHELEVIKNLIKQQDPLGLRFVKLLADEEELDSTTDACELFDVLLKFHLSRFKTSENGTAKFQKLSAHETRMIYYEYLVGIISVLRIKAPEFVNQVRVYITKNNADASIPFPVDVLVAMFGYNVSMSTGLNSVKPMLELKRSILQVEEFLDKYIISNLGDIGVGKADQIVCLKKKEILELLLLLKKKKVDIEQPTVALLCKTCKNAIPLWLKKRIENASSNVKYFTEMNELRVALGLLPYVLDDGSKIASNVTVQEIKIPNGIVPGAEPFVIKITPMFGEDMRKRMLEVIDDLVFAEKKSQNAKGYQRTISINSAKCVMRVGASSGGRVVGIESIEGEEFEKKYLHLIGRYMEDICGQINNQLLKSDPNVRTVCQKPNFLHYLVRGTYGLHQDGSRISVAAPGQKFMSFFTDDILPTKDNLLVFTTILGEDNVSATIGWTHDSDRKRKYPYGTISTEYNDSYIQFFTNSGDIHHWSERNDKGEGTRVVMSCCLFITDQDPDYRERFEMDNITSVTTSEDYIWTGVVSSPKKVELNSSTTDDFDEKDNSSLWEKKTANTEDNEEDDELIMTALSDDMSSISGNESNQCSESSHTKRKSRCILSASKNKMQKIDDLEKQNEGGGESMELWNDSFGQMEKNEYGKLADKMYEWKNGKSIPALVFPKQEMSLGKRQNVASFFSHYKVVRNMLRKGYLVKIRYRESRKDREQEPFFVSTIQQINGKFPMPNELFDQHQIELYHGQKFAQIINGDERFQNCAEFTHAYKNDPESFHAAYLLNCKHEYISQTEPPDEILPEVESPSIAQETMLLLTSKKNTNEDNGTNDWNGIVNKGDASDAAGSLIVNDIPPADTTLNTADQYLNYMDSDEKLLKDDPNDDWNLSSDDNPDSDDEFEGFVLNVCGDGGSWEQSGISEPKPSQMSPEDAAIQVAHNQKSDSEINKAFRNCDHKENLLCIWQNIHTWMNSGPSEVGKNSYRCVGFGSIESHKTCKLKNRKAIKQRFKRFPRYYMLRSTKQNTSFLYQKFYEYEIKQRLSWDDLEILRRHNSDEDSFTLKDCIIDENDRRLLKIEFNGEDKCTQDEFIQQFFDSGEWEKYLNETDDFAESKCVNEAPDAICEEYMGLTPLFSKKKYSMTIDEVVRGILYVNGAVSYRGHSLKCVEFEEGKRPIAYPLVHEQNCMYFPNSIKKTPTPSPCRITDVVVFFYIHNMKRQYPERLQRDCRFNIGNFGMIKKEEDIDFVLDLIMRSVVNRYTGRVHRFIQFASYCSEVLNISDVKSAIPGKNEMIYFFNFLNRFANMKSMEKFVSQQHRDHIQVDIIATLVTFKDFIAVVANEGMLKLKNMAQRNKKVERTEMVNEVAHMLGICHSGCKIGNAKLKAADKDRFLAGLIVADVEELLEDCFGECSASSVPCGSGSRDGFTFIVTEDVDCIANDAKLKKKTKKTCNSENEYLQLDKFQIKVVKIHDRIVEHLEYLYSTTDYGVELLNSLGLVRRREKEFYWTINKRKFNFVDVEQWCCEIKIAIYLTHVSRNRSERHAASRPWCWPVISEGEWTKEAAKIFSEQWKIFLIVMALAENEEMKVPPSFLMLKESNYF